jgi:hypothetical protein
MIGFPLGLLYANAGEWWLHKHVLHRFAKHKDRFWGTHHDEHHEASRSRDAIVERENALSWKTQGKELLALAALAIAHAPLFPVAPWFTAGVWYSIVRYHRVHRRAHLDPAWAREHLPWHVDHHRGPNPNANWCVTWPLMDIVMGTCEPHVDEGAELYGRPLAPVR